jgi:hypothetical protein
MHIRDGTPVGAVTADSGSVAVEIRMGEEAGIEGMHAIPVWRAGEGLMLLFLMTPRLPGPGVKKSGIAQAGAFVLCPGECFTLGGPGRDQREYQFRVAAAVEVTVGRGEGCAFCRSPFDGRAEILLMQRTEERLRGKALCNLCAEALRALGGDEGVRESGHEATHQ